MLKVLLGDVDRILMGNVRNRLEKDDLFILTTSDSGKEMIQLLSGNEFDIVVLDVLLKERDGFEVLRYIKDSRLKVRPIVLSDIMKRGVIKEAMSLGAWYYLSKNIDFDVLRDRIMFVADLKENRKVGVPPGKEVFLKNDRIGKFLMHLGFVPGRIGFRFLTTGVELAMQDSTLLGDMMGRMYPAIADKYDSTPSRVESSIRTITQQTFNNSPALREFLRKCRIDDTKKPANRQLINCINEYLENNHDEESTDNSRF